MAYQFILYDLSDGVGTVSLNRPDQMNALTPAMLQELSDVFRKMASDSNVRAIVLTGAGRAFCAGEDLRQRAEADLNPAPAPNQPSFEAFTPAFSDVPASSGGSGYTPSVVSISSQPSPQPKLVGEFAPLNPTPVPVENPRNQSAPAPQAREVAGGGPLFDPDTSEITANKGPISASEQLRRAYAPLIKQIRQVEKPVIAAVNGVAAGTGMGLALACDIRYASERAKFVEVSVRLGLLPGSGTAYFLPRLIGLSKALELAFNGDQLEAAEAEKLGLVSRVLPADKLMEETHRLAARLAKGPTRAIGLTKSLVYRSATLTLDQSLELESRLTEDAARTEDYKEGLRAYLDKRAPNYKGQ
jgi:2-(1,2-epoxy-1,2-dihydrophenyl)acetyl-CoA isomerase